MLRLIKCYFFKHFQFWLCSCKQTFNIIFILENAKFSHASKMLGTWWSWQDLERKVKFKVIASTVDLHLVACPKCMVGVFTTCPINIASGSMSNVPTNSNVNPLPLLTQSGLSWKSRLQSHGPCTVTIFI